MENCSYNPFFASCCKIWCKSTRNWQILFLPSNWKLSSILNEIIFQRSLFHSWLLFEICPQYCFKSTCESCDRKKSETRPQYTSRILLLDLERALHFPLSFGISWAIFTIFFRTLSTTLVLLTFDYDIMLIHVMKIKILKVIVDCNYQLGSYSAFHVENIGKVLIPILFVT